MVMAGWIFMFVTVENWGVIKPMICISTQGNGVFKEESAKYGLDDNGLSTHAAFFDYDHDGDLDCFVIIVRALLKALGIIKACEIFVIQ